MASTIPLRSAPPRAPGAPSPLPFCACHSARLDLVICLLDRAPHDTSLRFLKALLERNIAYRARKVSAA